MKFKKLADEKEITKSKEQAREEKESFEERAEHDLTTTLQQEQQQIQSHVLTSSPERRYNEVIQAAQNRVMNILTRLETRLAKRETDAVNKLTAISIKRPGRIARFLTKGEAMKKWNRDVKKQNETIFNIRKRKSTVKTIRTQSSNFQRQMQDWIRKRALRVDRDAVLVHDAAQEQRRQEAHRKSIEKIKEMEKRSDLTRGNEVAKTSVLERTMPTYR